MVKELVFGHQNPDTDAIDSAIEYSHLQNQLGMDTEAVALGEPNEETKFVLDHFQQPAPRVIQQAHDDVSAVMLVDHNEVQQSVADIDQVQVTHVVDHHRIANFETAAPLYYRAEPVGCTSTIIWKLYQEVGAEVTPTIAGLMLSAIISDTLLLKSPTTTDDDRQVVEKCAQIAHLDYQDYGLQMLKAGADISQKSAADLVDLDAKSFEMGGKTIRIAQINVVDLPAALQRQAEFQDAMENSCQSNNYDLFVLAITNVLDSDTTLLAHGTAELLSKVEGAFGKTFEQDQMALPGVVSRKKQIVPPLQNQF